MSLVLRKPANDQMGEIFQFLQRKGGGESKQFMCSLTCVTIFT